MPKPTKIVIYFDDGSTYETPTDKFGSLFIGQASAEKCKHYPPYGKPPGQSRDSQSSDTASTDSTTALSAEAGAMEGSCYLINGVIVCP